jgi:hypothetical protein
VYITWLKNSDCEESLDTWISRSTDAGGTFSAPSGVSGAEIGGVNLIPKVTIASSSSGKAYIVTPVGSLTCNDSSCNGREIMFRIVS